MDPIRPQLRKVRRYGLALAAVLMAAPSYAGGSRAWYLRKPPASTQIRRTATERGVNPCNTPDPGFGIYSHWDRGPSMGQLIAPQAGGLSASGEFDVMIHFHGHEAARKEWIQIM